MSKVFDDAKVSLAAVFNAIDGELARIENLDEQARGKQLQVDGLMAEETDLMGKIRDARATLAELNSSIASKLEEHANAKQAVDSMKSIARRVMAGL